jgi:hypothetical protein
VKRQEALDRLLEAVYHLREGGMTPQELRSEVERLLRQYDTDAVGLQMLQAELGHLMPPRQGEGRPRISVQKPPMRER